MKKLAVVLSILVLMCGCGGHSFPTIVEVTIAPANPPNIDQGQTLQFTASLYGDTNNQGVIWTVTGPGCAGATCGSFTNVTRTSATYVAPAAVSAALAVTITATSVAQSTQYAFSVLTVYPPPSITTTILPLATPGYIYRNTFAAVGGVQPYTWSLASGTLPPGMTLTPSGEIYGTPTAGITSTFTVKATDSSTAASGPLSTQQTFTLTVVGVLTVQPATLPAGTVGTSYTATIPLAGGVAPYAWSVYYGSVPSGLVLQNNGEITGIPTIPGTYTFQVYVVDSSPVQQNYTSGNYSITINPSGPLTIRTTSLLDGVAGTAYQGQVVATGGTLPFSWSITTGSLPTGLSFDTTTGAITGTPTAAPGTYPFTVQVTDSSSPQETSTQALAITINAAPAACTSTGNNGALNGQYAFSLRGFNGGGFLAVVGSFIANGSGSITSGEADTNGVLGPQNGSIIASASSYSVGPDNRGCATLATPFGTFYTHFALGTMSEGVAGAGSIIEFETPGSTAYVASGQIVEQTPADFVYNIIGSFALQTSGWDFSTSGRIACVGSVAAASNKISYLQQDCNDNGTVTNTVNTINTSNSTENIYSAADMNGRGTGNFAVGTGTSTWVFYWATPTTLFFVNSDANPASSGVWQQQVAPTGYSSFRQNAFQGNAAFYATGLVAAGAGGNASFGPQTADGVNSVTSTTYLDTAGALQSTNSTCNYSIVSIGRATLTGSNCGATPPISYFDGPNSAVVVGTDPTGQLGALVPQTTGLTVPAIAGTYYLGTSEIVSQSATAEVGSLTISANGTVTSTIDSTSTLTQAIGTAGTDTYALNADGTLTTASSGGATVGIAISSNNFVIIENPTLAFPTLAIAHQ